MIPWIDIYLVGLLIMVGVFAVAVAVATVGLAFCFVAHILVDIRGHIWP